MNKTFHTLIIVFLFSNIISAQSKVCSRTTNFGDAKICLPKIDGHQECYTEPDVKQLADATEVPMNTVLAYYINDETYAIKDSTGLQGMSDFFKIYGTLELKDYQANDELLKQMEEIISGSFMEKNWDLMHKEIDKLNLEIEVGVPTMIKSYNHTEDSFTCILITKYDAPDLESTTVTLSINGMLLNERLVWMAYYLPYDGEQSIIALQKNSNRILDVILTANK